MRTINELAVLIHHGFVDACCGDREPLSDESFIDSTNFSTGDQDQRLKQDQKQNSTTEARSINSSTVASC
jgi:hypothetical protein